MWTPPFNLQLAETEEETLLDLIPKDSNDERIYDSRYHEMKIELAVRFEPKLSRVEAWALSMYLGPTYYYRNINLSLAGITLPGEERNKFLLIAKAATIGLLKIPAITITQLQALPQPILNRRYQYLKRYTRLSSERLKRYQVGRKVTELAFTSTTYWQDTFGAIQRYSEQATAVFHINPNLTSSLGRYIDPIKRATREGEILFPPSTQFRVQTVQYQEYPVTDGESRELVVIELDEL